MHTPQKTTHVEPLIASDSEELFRVAVDASPTGMIVIDALGGIVLANVEALRLFGYKREQLQGQPIELLVPERHRSSHMDTRHEYFKQPGTRRMGAGRDLAGRRSDGSEFPLEIGLNPVVTRTGQCVIASVTDLSARKQVESELRARTEELARSNSELEQFAFSASHDLQEPLRAVAGCVQLLKRRYAGKLDARAEELIELAIDETVRMRQLIDDLLTFSRVGSHNLEQAEVNCIEVLNRSLAGLKASIDESGAVIEYSSLPTVLGDAAQLTRLFANLIGNAIKFKRELPPKVSIECVTSGTEHRFCVRDNGIGIDPRHFQRIFGVFQRLHTHQEYPGTGIGLALCAKIVMAHGGRIWVESELDEGSRFCFSIPAAPNF